MTDASKRKKKKIPQPCTVRVDARRHRAVTRYGVCPGCGDFRIVTRTRMHEDAETGRRKFSGQYLSCGSDAGHECWSMTKSPEAERIYETFGARSKSDHRPEAP